MGELRADSPGKGLLPLDVGGIVLRREEIGTLTSLAAFRGQQEALSEALMAAHGMALPEVNRSSASARTRAIWFGRGQTMLMGDAPDPGLSRHAALTDQSDAWAAMRLHGPGAVDVLARLVPLDLRSHRFLPGHTARAPLMHMAASITGLDDQAFLIMVFRSMAATAVHELKTAMEGVAARG